MKIKQNSSVFSVRIDTDILEAFDLLIGKNENSRSGLIKDLMLQEIIKTSKELEKIPFEIIPISKNEKNLGYKRTFFNREDAEFVFDGKWMILMEEDKRFNRLKAPTAEQRENEINDYLLTGVKYEIQQSNIVIYSIFDFSEDRNDSNKPIILMGKSAYMYNKLTDIFEECTNYDFFEI